MTNKTLAKLDQLITDANPFLAKAKKAEESVLMLHELRKGEYSSYTSSVLHFFTLILNHSSPYIHEYNKSATTYTYKCVQNGIDVLQRIKQDVKDGWLVDTKGIISAEIFSDFLEMAEHLLDENYKDPAAVVIGSVLEEHLRNLCVKNKIDTTYLDIKGKLVSKKASTLNDDLLKAGIYNNLEQKSVTAWLDLRNKAAHGKYAEYDLSQVKGMLQNINDFIVRNQL